MASWWTAGGGGGAAGGRTAEANQEGAGGGGKETHYQVLGLGADADAASIRAAYQREVLLCHPDKQAARNDDNDNDNDNDNDERWRRRFAAVQGAYAALRDPGARAEYDAQLALRAQMEAASQITPAEELDLSEMDVEEDDEEEEIWAEAGGGDGGEAAAAAEGAAAAAADATTTTPAEHRRREVATYPCRCGDLYRLPMRAVRAAASEAAAAGAAGPADALAPPPPPLLVQCRGCSNHALVRLSR